jgi:hypothetical protein
MVRKRVLLQFLVQEIALRRDKTKQERYILYIHGVGARENTFLKGHASHRIYDEKVRLVYS